MLTTRTLLQRSPRPLLHLRNLSTTSSSALETVPLAFAKYDPPSTPSKPAGNAPLVIMHGLFGSKQNHRSISKALAQATNNTVYALDLRNHGDSPHAPVHDYPHMAADIEQFITAHSLPPTTTLIGHSMGAKAAMAVGLRRPDLISKLVIVDNAPVEALLSSSFGNYVRAMKKAEAAECTKHGEVDKILAEVEENVAVRQFLMTNLMRKEGEMKLSWRVPVATLGKALDTIGGFPWHPDRTRCEKPALFVRGSRSHYVPDEVIPLIGRFFPYFRMKDIDAGHWVISEKPNEFKEAVVEFLDATNDD